MPVTTGSCVIVRVRLCFQGPGRVTYTLLRLGVGAEDSPVVRFAKGLLEGRDPSVSVEPSTLRGLWPLPIASFFEPRSPDLLFDFKRDVKLAVGHIVVERAKRFLEAGVLDAGELYASR